MTTDKTTTPLPHLDEDDAEIARFAEANTLAGRRIRLIEPLRDDPTPLPAGTEGTVLWVTHHPTLGFMQIAMRWDNEVSNLMLSVPPDRFEVVK